VAKDAGIFQKHGLDAQIVNVRSGPIGMSALASGETQFHVGSATGASIGAMAGGLDLVFIAGLINKLDGAFVVAPNIRTPSDLKGKRIGLQSIGGGIWMFTMLALEHWGLNPERDNIQLRVIGDQSVLAQAVASDIIDGAYWLRPPGPNAAAVIAFTGAIAPEAMLAAGLIAEDRRDVGLLAITSADRLNAAWQAAGRARQRGNHSALSHIERLLAPLSRECGIVTVLDGHPAALAWIGGVYGHRVKALGVEHFGQSGTIADLYRHYGIDANAIVNAVNAVSIGRPIRHMRALP